jgi:signal transduction histidine kinase
MNKIKQIFHPIIYAGTETFPNFDPQYKRVIGINQMCLAVAFINLSIGVFSYFLTWNRSLLMGVLVEIALVAIPVILNHHRKWTLASMTLYIIIAAATFYFCCILGKLVEAQLTIVYLIGVAMFMFPGWPARILCILIGIAVLFGVEENFKHAFIRPLDAPDPVRYFMRYAAYGVVIFLVVFTFDLFWRNGQGLYSKLDEYAKKVKIHLQEEELENKIKDKFISNATHEMRVSFYSIFSILETLSKIDRATDMKDKKDLRGSIDDLKAACRYSKSIIDNILEYERFRAGLKNPVLAQLVDIRLLLRGIVDIYRYLADEKKVRIDWQVSEDLPYHIVCDEMKIRQIITNLLHNAIKFTHNETRVTILVVESDGCLVLAFRDEGDGIDPQDQGSIFEAFVTRNPDGLGLGLYIVREHVAMMQGKISAANRPEGGALFTVTLPLPEVIRHPSGSLSLS